MASRVSGRSHLSHLECSACGATVPADEVAGTCPACGKVLFSRYDLPSLRSEMPVPDFAGRPQTLWRYRELLPIRDERFALTLGEGRTPLIALGARSRRAAGLDGVELLVKEEGLNPTGSFKARGLAVAVARAAELGVRHVALPSAGNAGGAAAAYAAMHGIACHVAMPRDAPIINQQEVALYGAELILVDGLIDAAGRLIRERAADEGWFDLSTLKEPYRAEGKKTMGIELAEDGGWGDAWCPDVVVYPTGGGTGIVGMWKAWAELEELGWIGSRRPRMVVVQADGCAPIVRAFDAGADRAEPWEGGRTIASGMRVPAAIGDYLILRAVHESGGTAVAVSDGEISEAQRQLARTSGIWAAPEGAATFAALGHLRDSGFLGGGEQIVLFNTGTGSKYAPPIE
ncbi:MAG: threonine synthase [Chloroflexi bacterium]|nr:threonine synthase [Chloroflexota bacterium]